MTRWAICDRCDACVLAENPCPHCRLQDEVAAAFDADHRARIESETAQMFAKWFRWIRDEGVAGESGGLPQPDVNVRNVLTLLAEGAERGDWRTK